MEPDYTAKIESYKRKNLAEVANGLPKDKDAKLLEQCSALCLSDEDTKETFAFLNSDSVAARVMRALHYAKKPSRQNVYEAAFLDFLHDKYPFHTVRSLPSKGPLAIYPEQGAIVRSPEKSQENRAKSFDFLIEGDGRVIHVAHKFTNEEGGAQDNQYNDLIETGKQCRGLRGCAGVLLVPDGPYYLRPHSRDHRIARTDFLKRLVGAEPNVAACRGAEFSLTFAGLGRSMTASL